MAPVARRVEDLDADVAGRIRDLPPSAKLLLRILLRHGASTQQELVERSWLPLQTARWGLHRLVDEDLVERTTHPEDTRRRLYAPTRRVRQAADQLLEDRGDDHDDRDRDPDRDDHGDGDAER